MKIPLFSHSGVLLLYKSINCPDEWFKYLKRGISPVFIYPSDVVKSNMQVNKLSLRNTCQNIYKSQGIPGFYKGFSLGIFRAFPLHGGVFLGYELSKKFI